MGRKRQRARKQAKETEGGSKKPRPLGPEQQQQQQEEKPRMEQLESDDYFEVLGLSRASATESEIKRAYRKLAVQWHPDKNRSHARAEEYFKKIGEAYAVLSDPEKRKIYERYGKEGLGGASTGTGAAAGNSDPFSGGYGDHFGFHGHPGFSSRHARDIFEAFFSGGDPFEAFFGGGGGTRRSSRARGNEWSGSSPGFGFGGGGFGGLGMMMMDSMFDDSFGSGFGGGGGGYGGFSQSVSSSSYTDRDGHVVTKKTTTTIDASGRSETLTEEFRNGHLVNSASSASNSRLADAGRRQLHLESIARPDGGIRNGSSRNVTAETNAYEQQTPPRRLGSSRSRARF